MALVRLVLWFDVGGETPSRGVPTDFFVILKGRGIPPGLIQVAETLYPEIHPDYTER